MSAPSVDDLSVPLAFTLPPKWQQLDPDTNGAPGSAMLALYEERGETFTPSITIGIQRRLGGVTQELVQSQVHIEVPLAPPTPGEVPADRLAIELTGTSGRDQASTVLRDFQTFVDSVHVEVRPEDSGTDAPRHQSPTPPSGEPTP